MIEIIAIVAIVFLGVAAWRRGWFSWLAKTPSTHSTPSIFASRESDAPPTASAWEKRLLADSLDDFRRERAKAALFAELSAVATSQAASQAAMPFVTPAPPSAAPPAAPPSAAPPATSVTVDAP